MSIQDEHFDFINDESNKELISDYDKIWHSFCFYEVVCLSFNGDVSSAKSHSSFCSDFSVSFSDAMTSYKRLKSTLSDSSYIDLLWSNIFEFRGKLI